MLGVELARACPQRTIGLTDCDQAQHLSRMLELHPPGLPNLILGVAAADITLIDTAPEANYQALQDVAARADWLLIPVKGPETGSVQVLPAFLRWFVGAADCRLLGFLPTMYKPRRAEARRWMGELQILAEKHGARVFEPIPDSAALADWNTRDHPYARLARDVLTIVEKEGL
jgi:cellulose biosynthesis protein BcsQ